MSLLWVRNNIKYMIMKQILLSTLMLVCIISVKAQDAMVATSLSGEQSKAFVNEQFITGQSVDDLQYRLDNPVQTRAEKPIIVNLSEYDALERDRPLYVRNGKSYQFINGTLKRTAALKDSTLLVISANSYVELGEGAILSGGRQQTNHELVLLETGSFKLSSGEIKDCYNPLIIPSAKYDNAVLVKTLNSSFEMTGGKIANTAGVVSLGGPMTFTGGNIAEGSIQSNTDFLLDGSFSVSAISLNGKAKIRITSELKNTINIRPSPLSELKLTPAQPDNIGDYEGVVVAIGENYTLTENDVKKIKSSRLSSDKWKFVLENNQIVIRRVGGIVDAAVRTEEALKQAIANATGTCSGEPTVIKIDGEIPISTIYIQDKSVKLTGGTLKRASGYTDGLFMLNNACLTLEDIVIDGNKAAYTDNRMIIWPPFSLSNQAKLTINKGTDIRNHRVNNSHLGLISIDISDKVACTVLMNGGSIHDNEVPSAELITDIGFKLLSLDMKGGSIVGNTTGYGVANVNTFTMSGGTIGDNISNYFHNVSTQTGVIKSEGIIKEGKGIRVYSDLKIEGDGTNIADSIILNDPAARISRNGAQKSELVLNHSAFHASKLVAGTVVVAGCDGYQLTADDLNKYRYKNSAWQLELSGNTIVLKENAGQSFENGDDLQDFLDGLGQSGNTGTEKDPIDIVFTGEPIRLSQPLLVPEGTHVIFNGGSFIRGEALKSTVSSGTMLDIPANASLTLANTTFDGGKKEAEDALISISGQLKISDGSVIKGALNKNGIVGSAVHVASTGVLTMSGGVITDNAGKQGSAVFNEGTFTLSGGSIYGNTSEIGNIVNYEHSQFTMTGGIVRDNKVTQGCGGIYIAENSQATFSAGEIRANGHSDVYSWSDVKYGGNMNVSGLFLVVESSKVLISSALQYSLKLGHIAETVTAGVIVAQGTGGYKLTNQDLAKISCPDEKWMYVLKDGAILLAEKGSTSIENIQSSGNVYVENGSLVLAGQKIGEPYFIYSISGHLVHTGKITSERHACFLKETGIFIVKCGKGSYKVANFHKN